MCSPEFKWRAHTKRLRQLDLVPDHSSRNDPLGAFLAQMGMGPARPPARQGNPARREDHEPLLTMLDEMAARAKLLATEGFRPSQYPGLTPEAVASDDQGWVAWFILEDVRTALRYAGHEKHEQLPAIERAVARTADLATQFIRGLQKNLDVYQSQRVERAITDVLASRGNGGGDYANQEASEPERERVNALLRIRSPWAEPQMPPSIVQQVIDQLRASGRSDDDTLKILIADGWEYEPEVAKLRREIRDRAAARGEPDSSQVAPTDASPEIPARPGEPPKAIRTPSDRALTAWRVCHLAGVTDQTEIATVMTQNRVPATQGQVSRWLRQVASFLQAGGVLPPMPAPTRKVVSVDPRDIEIGEEQEGRSRYQRRRRSDQADE